METSPSRISPLTRALSLGIASLIGLVSGIGLSLAFPHPLTWLGGLVAGFVTVMIAVWFDPAHGRRAPLLIAAMYSIIGLVALSRLGFDAAYCSAFAAALWVAAGFHHVTGRLTLQKILR